MHNRGPSHALPEDTSCTPRDPSRVLLPPVAVGKTPKQARWMACQGGFRERPCRLIATRWFSEGVVHRPSEVHLRKRAARFPERLCRQPRRNAGARLATPSRRHGGGPLVPLRPPRAALRRPECSRSAIARRPTRMPSSPRSRGPASDRHSRAVSTPPVRSVHPIDPIGSVGRGRLIRPNPRSWVASRTVPEENAELALAE
jgi:hypothetical protein